MQYSKTFGLAMLAAATVSAVPFAEPEADYNVTVISKRAPFQPVSCGPDGSARAWTQQVVENAYNQLVATWPSNNKPAAGTTTYPHTIAFSKPNDSQTVPNALNAIPECAATSGLKWYEFPLTDPAFTGGAAGSQGADRVVAAGTSHGQGQPITFVYCLSMTHNGAPNDATFVPCTNAP